jgi:23S rRNA (cytidine2498-2'-O)-methyltransferase
VAPLVQAETGSVEDVRNPQVIISILALPTVGFVGISTAQDNLSNWAGGARRFARETGQLTRSEFKLLEALEVFDEELSAGGEALDLGASPGGWTRVLHNAGMNVTAVDPAPLDASLANLPGITSVQGYAQEWVQSATRAQRKWDVIVNDARMDARDAARFMVDVAPLMHLDSFAILTLKLPSAEAERMDPVRIAHTALDELRSRYRTVRARQLFHNRNEVTAYLRL